ncbi:sensor histidine kinase [Chelatococcus reniformis]|uniref:Blue-light-activated histidine kinase n=1 Tax=Chelatococcus reniformis TaxID=1494448 RepID=A0A916XCB5_9HYPH|nr:HWE histidine kinase domain-containing protein [Chelatococcus reniformis]GGC63078.1 histidine kinase [Chelatococcus reniformis]
MSSGAAVAGSGLRVLDGLANGLIALACFVIVLAIVQIVRRRQDLVLPYRRVAWRVSAFLIVVGASSVIGMAQAAALGEAWLTVARFAVAVAGIGVLIAIWRMPNVIAAIPSHADIRRANARLIAEAEAHVRTLKELQTVRDELEMRVAERTRDLDEARYRYAFALRGSGVTLFMQDEALTYIWVSRPIFGLGLAEDEIVGKTDEDVIPESSRTRMLALKRSALQSGGTQTGEISIETAEGVRWWDIHVEPTFGDEGVRLYCAAVDITELKQGEQRLRFLMREVTHRSKNMLAVIQAMARQTAAGSGSLPEFLHRFGDRLQSLSASQDLLVQETGAGVPLAVLIRSQLGHAADLIGGQIRLDGPPVTLGGDAIQHLGLALHELATNAAKYGSLSTPDGRVNIDWSVEAATEGDRFRMSWREEGGPPVAPPSRRGFGQVVIERTVARTLAGEVELRYAPEGVHWTLDAPADNVLVQSEA